MPKAICTPTTAATLARRRHTRAAPGALDRRLPAPAVSTLIVRVPVSEDGGFPFTTDPALMQLHWTSAITPGVRQRVERDVELLIAFLDALDASAEDLEEADPAEDGDPAECNGDLELTCEDQGEQTEDDYPVTERTPLCADGLPGAAFVRERVIAATRWGPKA